MKFKAIITSVFFIGTLFTGAAFAADQGPTTEGPPYDTRGGAAEGQRGVPQQESRPGQQMTRDGQAAGDTGFFQDEQIPGMYRAENLIGKNVVSQQGNDLGSINDLVVSEDGQIEYIVLARGGVLGVGGDNIAVPWDAANIRRGQDDQLMADITEQQLEGAPTFENYAQFSAEGYEQQVHSYFGTEPRTEREFQPGQMNQRNQ